MEIVEVIDKNNGPLSRRALAECLKLGLLHRAVAIVLRNFRDGMFLQRRSLTDEWMPGKWTLSCTGHVRAGENPEEAAKRELKEELGLETDLQFLFRKVLPKIEFHGRIEHEISFVFETRSDAIVSLDPREVEEGRFLTVDESKDFFENRAREITPDAVILFHKYVELTDL